MSWKYAISRCMETYQQSLVYAGQCNTVSINSCKTNFATSVEQDGRQTNTPVATFYLQNHTMLTEQSNNALYL